MKSRAFLSLFKPLSILFLILWTLNDLLWKEMFHNFWTGKLSDLTSLFLVPLFLTAIFALFYKEREDALFRFNLVFIGILFAAINLSQDFNDFYTYGIYGSLFGKENVIQGRADILDLITLPMLYLSYRFYFNTKHKSLYPKEILVGFLVLSFNFFAVVNTSCGDCGGGSNKLFLLSSILFDVKQKKPLPMNLNPEAPADSAKFLKGDLVEFKWNFLGKEATPDYMEKYPYSTNKTEGGTFAGYRIQIYSNSDFNADTKPVFESADTREFTIQTNIDVAQGTYYWIPVLVFEHGEQKEKRIEILNRKFRSIHLSF